MSDKVKLIIEIPKHLYDVIKNKECTNRNVITTAVENGIPLDDVKAEIEQLRLHKAEFLTNDNKVCIDSQTVLEILDNIGKEREEKVNGKNE